MWARHGLLKCRSFVWVSLPNTGNLVICSHTQCRAQVQYLWSLLPWSSASSSYHAVSQTFMGSLSSLKQLNMLVQYRTVVYNKVTKNKLLMNKKRDASFENSMDDEKRMNLMRRIVKLLLHQPKQKMLFRFMLRRGGYVGLVKPQKMGDILQKYPRIIRIYRNPNEVDVWVGLAKPILQLLEEEKALKLERANLAAERLRKVLMLSAKRRIRLDRIHFIKEELGLPDDYKKSVIRANPHLFKLVITRVDLNKGISPSVKLLEWDPTLAVPALEAYRQDPATTSGLDEEGKKKKAYAFPISYPPGLKLTKAFRIKQRKWQELRYRSPYADTSDLDMKSAEAAKRAAAVLHEFLHITVEKRTRVERVAHLREDFMLPVKVGVTVLQNPGIFYMSTKSSTQTIFLREAYKKGALINKDPLSSIKEKFMELLKMGRKNVSKKKGLYALSDSDTSEDEAENGRVPMDMMYKDEEEEDDNEEGGFFRKAGRHGEHDSEMDSTNSDISDDEGSGFDTKGEEQVVNDNNKACDDDSSTDDNSELSSFATEDEDENRDYEYGKGHKCGSSEAEDVDDDIFGVDEVGN